MRRHADDSPNDVVHIGDGRCHDLPMTEDSQLSDLSAVMIEITDIPSSAQTRDVGG